MFYACFLPCHILYIYNFYCMFSFDFSCRITPIQYNTTWKATFATLGRSWKWVIRWLGYWWQLGLCKPKKLAIYDRCDRQRYVREVQNEDLNSYKKERIMLINIWLIEMLQNCHIFLNDSTLEIGQNMFLGSWQRCNLLDGMPTLWFNFGNCF